MYNNPEHLLQEINGAALTVLKMSHSLPRSEDLTEAQERLKDGLKQTLLAQMLTDNFCIAVCGVQGVGKSTLVSSLYDLGKIIPENNGQGELLPLLITEEDSIRGKPDAFVRSLTRDPDTEEIRVEELSLNIELVWKRSREPKLDDLLIHLKVPKRYGLHSGSGILLLPGWQPDSKKLEKTNSLTKIALLSAARCLFVIDPGKTAKKEQHELNQEIKATFKDTEFFVALTHSDKSSDGNEEERESTSQRFNISKDRIFCVGTFDDPSKNKEWKNHIIDGVTKWGESATSHQALRLRKVKEALEKIRSAYGPIERSLRKADDANQVLEEKLNGYIKKFDRSSNALRRCVDEYAQKVLQHRAGGAIDQLNEHFHGSENGFARFKEGIGDFFRGGPNALEFLKLIRESWEKGGPNALSADRLLILNASVSKRLEIQGVNWPTEFNGISTSEQAKLSLKPPSGLGGSISDKLAFKDAHPGHASTAVALSWLIQQKSTSLIPGEGLEYALELLPILMIEYHRLRIASHGVLTILPQNENSQLFSEELNPKLVEILRECEAGFPKGNSVKLIFTSLASMLGLDLAIDGNIDSLGSLAAAFHGAASAGTAGTALALSTHALFAVGALIAAAKTWNLVATDLYRSNMHKSRAANVMIGNFSSRMHASYLSDFDSIMDDLREKVIRRIEQQCNIPEERSLQLNAMLAMKRLDFLCDSAIGAIDASVPGLLG